MHEPSPHTGLLVSVEGINGVGKDYLLERFRPQLAAPSHTIAEFSARMRTDGTPGLSEQILKAMHQASHGDHFLRGGTPRSETLLLFAVKTHDYEHSRPRLDAGDIVLEGRSLHSTAVYQALILQQDRPLETARRLLALGAQWRPLPDLTIFVTDDVDTALERAQQRDHKQFTAEERLLHHQADELFRALAASSDRSRILDRRTAPPDDAAARIAEWINEAPRAAHIADVPEQRTVSPASGEVSP
ncbi:dTMP kinase [Streptomyces sp. NPDC056486]|uniref:dTMP kinase n=1 Tax=Streptomyces sp. NPDC056486 TaxID=3345835 RepID=UPI0036769B62